MTPNRDPSLFGIPLLILVALASCLVQYSSKMFHVINNFHYHHHNREQLHETELNAFCPVSSLSQTQHLNCAHKANKIVLRKNSYVIHGNCINKGIFFKKKNIPLSLKGTQPCHVPTHMGIFPCSDNRSIMVKCFQCSLSYFIDMVSKWSNTLNSLGL